MAAAKARTPRTTDATQPASALIDEKIELLGDWRGETLAQIRRIIHAADPAVVEEWKWGTPVWSHSGILCTGETYKAKVKLTFPRGAEFESKTHLFNSSLEGNVRRAVDFHEGEKLDKAALTALIRAAVAQNSVSRSAKKTAQPQAVSAIGKKPVKKSATPKKGTKAKMSAKAK